MTVFFLLFFHFFKGIIKTIYKIETSLLSNDFFIYISTEKNNISSRIGKGFYKSIPDGIIEKIHFLVEVLCFEVSDCISWKIPY